MPPVGIGFIGRFMSTSQRSTLSAGPADGRAASPGGWLPVDARRVFSLLWLASLVLPLALLIAAGAWAWRTIEEEAGHRVSRTVDMLHEHALRSLETQEAVLEAIDQRLRGLSWDEIARSVEIHEFLAALERRSLPSGGIVLVSPDRRIVAGSRRFPVAPIDASDRDYTNAFAHEATGTFLGEPVLARPSANRVFPVSRPRTLDGESSGWIVTSFRPDYFEEFYRSVAEDEEDVISLIRADGAVLASTFGGEQRDGRLADGGALARLVQSSPVSGILSARSAVDGVERLIAYRAVSGYPLYSVYGLNRNVIRDAWLREVRIYALICAAAVLLLLLLTWRVQTSVLRERLALAEAGLEAKRRAEAESRLLHAQKIDALGQIVGGVAHDFNNIVQAMKGGASRVARRAEDPDEVRRVAAMIEASADRGARLIARMLAFARREQTKTEWFDPRETLTEISELLSETIGSGYRVTLTLPDAMSPAKADRSEFETAVVNLVLNARDAMPQGGTIAVSATTEVDGGVSDHGSGDGDARFLSLTVADTGTGMDPETLGRAGEPFFTTKAADKGTGLGLATVRAFVEQAGGSMTIDSAVGRGTRITLRLPTA